MTKIIPMTLGLALSLTSLQNLNAIAPLRPVSTQLNYKINTFTAELLYFEGRNANSVHLITWATSAESDVKGYHLEKLQGNQWVAIQFIPPANAAAEYEARVFQTIGVQSYRLRIFGADGTDLYSQVIQVGTAAGASGAITPTAVRDWASIDIELSQFIEQVSILDIQGRVVNTPILEGNRLDLSALASGLYIVRVQTNASIWTQKITKQ